MTNTTKLGSTGSKNPPDFAAQRESGLPGALSSPSNPRESEEFWADLGRVPDAYPPVSGAPQGQQKGCKSRLLPLAGLIVALALGSMFAFAEAASAWHGELTCTKFHLVGTPVHLEWWQSGKNYARGDVRGAWDQWVNVPAPPGYGPITVKGTWNAPDSPYQYTTPYPCGVKPPPPPPPTPPAPPTPPPAPAAPAPPPAPTTPVAVPPAAPTACVPYPKSRYRLIDSPPMNSIDHGKVTFRVRGPHIRWVTFQIDHRYQHVERAKPFKLTTYLWRTDMWGAMPRPLYGYHRIRATVHTTCGAEHLGLLRFNRDP